MARKSRKRNRNAKHSSGAAAAGDQPSAVTEPDISASPAVAMATIVDSGNVSDTTADAKAANAPVIDAISENTALIQQLIDQMNGLASAPIDDQRESNLSDPNQDELNDEIAELSHRNTELKHRNEELLQQLQLKIEEIEELRQQSTDLATQVASSNVRQTVSTIDSGCNDALSWDQRKALILEQMEQETFDAEEFVETLQEEIESEEQDSPQQIVEKLFNQLSKVESELADRNTEIGELRELLHQQSETRDGGIAIGAAAIAQMVDSDELVMQERERLQLLQDQWEEKFRQSEIEASLERAKLSRERQQLAKKTEELEEKIEHLRRENQQTIEHADSGTSRRWLAKLGLSDSD